MPHLITLTTDFGTKDSYVAQMKGVLLNIDPELRIVDLSHQLPAQDVLAGALFIQEAFPLFPHGTVHIVVVDPGVGTNRRVVAVRIAGQTIVLPDNGLLSCLLQQYPLEAAHVIQPSAWWREPLSKTFHGRDIMAPVGGALACGKLRIEDVGEACHKVEQLAVPSVLEQPIGSGLRRPLQLAVIQVDHFGNLITNLSPTEIAATELRVHLNGQEFLTRVVATYAQAQPDDLVALTGSSGRFEIALVNGSAAAKLRAQVGDSLTIHWD